VSDQKPLFLWLLLPFILPPFHLPSASICLHQDFQACPSELSPPFPSRSSQSFGTTQLRQSPVTTGPPRVQPSLLLGACLEGWGRAGSYVVGGELCCSSPTHPTSGFLSYHRPDQLSPSSNDTHLGPMLQPPLPCCLLLCTQPQHCLRL
jgi:hypothetical protein